MTTKYWKVSDICWNGRRENLGETRGALRDVVLPAWGWHAYGDMGVGQGSAECPKRLDRCACLPALLYSPANISRRWPARRSPHLSHLVRRNPPAPRVIPCVAATVHSDKYPAFDLVKKLPRVSANGSQIDKSDTFEAYMKLCLLPQIVRDGSLVGGTSSRVTRFLRSVREGVLYRVLDPLYARTLQLPSSNPSQVPRLPSPLRYR